MKIIETSKIDYLKFKKFLLQNYSINNEIIEFNKFFNNNNNNNNNNNKNLINFEINFNQIIFDIFSIYKKEINLLNPLKNKMRFLTFLSKISIKIKENSFEIQISNLSSFLLKGLDLNPFVTSILTNNLTNKNTLINFLGFSHILTINSLKISILNKKTQILLNFNTNSIEFFFCIDSLKFFNELILKLIEDFFNINFHVKILEDDNETIITTETEIQREKNFLNEIEFKNVAYSDNENFNNRNFKMKNLKEKKEINNKIINNNFELISFGFFINKFKIYFFDGEDFNFQMKINFNYNENFAFNDENKIIKINQRNLNENVIFNLNEINFLINNFKNSEKFLSIVFILKSLIIEDNIKNSIYKKVFSNTNFEDSNEILLKFNLNFLKNMNNINANNGECFVISKFDFSNFSIYLDQETLIFLLKFIFSIKFKLNNNNNFYNNNNNEILINSSVNTENEISKINYPLFNNNNQLLNLNINPKLIYSTEININNFTLTFSFNSKNLNFNNEIPNNIKFFLEKLNIISLKKLQISFLNYTNTEKILIKSLLINLYNFYKNDIISNQIYGSFIKALPFINSCCHLIEGVFHITKIPFDERNISLDEKIVNGTRGFVICTSSELLSLSEVTSNFFRKIFCCAAGNEREKSIYRKLKYKVDVECKKEEEYFFK